METHHSAQPTLVIGQMQLLQIAMGESNQPPNYGEEQPRTDETEGEHQQSPAPLSVHQRREDVLQEADMLLRYLGR